METSTPQSSVGEPSVGFGLVMACTGIYFMLIGADVLPPPGDQPARAPGWVAGAAGLAFLLGGIAMINQARAMAKGHLQPDNEISEAAPRWQQAVHYLVGLGVAGCLAGIGTWIAIGSGERKVEVSGLPGMSGPVNEMIGRGVFGFGAVIVWLFVVALAVKGARKFLGRAKPP